MAEIMVEARTLGDLIIDDISHLAVEVTDLDRAGPFWRDVLGLKSIGSDIWPDCGHHLVFRAPSGQSLILAQNANRPDLTDTGVHLALRVGAGFKDRIAGKLTDAGVEVHRYFEDRPAEEADNFYFFDPDGNRIQLVDAAGAAGTVTGIDHAGVQVADILWAEEFYTGVLGVRVEHRMGWSTADYVRARDWAEGKEDMAPGTRRLDKRYTVMVDRKTVPRANMQIFLGFGRATLAVFLANQHFQEPLEELMVGTPRVAFTTTAQGLDAAALTLEQHQIPHDGPVRHPSSAPVGRSLYFKDPGGNFLELCTPD
ncbi:MAG: VOC family protein [Alphaproteobacteria bacterium]